ncbi:hypothetical protein TRP8649_03619 [Pelagimonas phthalicica]|uniref:Uncharacterized protein n=1 Tax=Pelagimonas phthalicica TaxID=1037362 RepID=A0A238JGG1_9RHOB|nr:hypothetical protein [Pelagimonas phthalicica]TDS92422.1 hypothetical protein CLV87_3617 [Pelagimonas phthalicica]SMX29483.1 hypothetical protein TRP8649_03619 [Pelagimonas phthalicica]
MLRELVTKALAISALAFVLASPAVAQDVVTNELDELYNKVKDLDAVLATFIADLDKDIAEAEANAGFGASADLIDQIEVLKAKRAEFVSQRKELQLILSDIKETD